MNVDQWSSVEERRRLLTIFEEGGDKALMKELRQMGAGYIVPPAFVRWPSWEVDVKKDWKRIYPFDLEER